MCEMNVSTMAAEGERQLAGKEESELACIPVKSAQFLNGQLKRVSSALVLGNRPAPAALACS